MNRFLIKVLLFLTFLVFITGCENDYPDSIYNPDETFMPNPVITAISPDSAFAGVDTIDIAGENFSSNIEDISVFFNGQRGEVVSASPNLVRAISANIIGDSIKIQLWIKGALEFAVFDSYKLEPIMITYGNFDNFDYVYGIECDLEENIYISLTGKKIEKISQDLSRNNYATLGTGRDIATQMRIGPDGAIYFVFGLEYLLRIIPGGGSDEFVATLPGGASDLDFDSDLNLYIAGNKGAVYRSSLTDLSFSVVKEYPDVALKAIRIFENYIYVAGKYSGDNVNTPIMGVWKNQIIENSDVLGETELVFDFDANFPGFEIQSLEIAEDGDLYLGTTAPEAIIVVHPGGSFEPLYPGVLTPNVYAMTWGNGNFLYFTRRFIVKDSNNEEKEIGEVLRINMRKQSAPYFGRQ